MEIGEEFRVAETESRPKTRLSDYLRHLTLDIDKDCIAGVTINEGGLRQQRFRVGLSQQPLCDLRMLLENVHEERKNVDLWDSARVARQPLAL